jgi:hypothetical protein
MGAILQWILRPASPLLHSRSHRNLPCPFRHVYPGVLYEVVCDLVPLPSGRRKRDLGGGFGGFAELCWARLFDVRHGQGGHFETDEVSRQEICLQGWIVMRARQTTEARDERPLRVVQELVSPHMFHEVKGMRYSGSRVSLRQSALPSSQSDASLLRGDPGVPSTLSDAGKAPTCRTCLSSLIHSSSFDCIAIVSRI